jgi:hypothetical protein
MPVKWHLSKASRLTLGAYFLALTLPWMLDYGSSFFELGPYNPQKDRWYSAIWKPDFWYEKETSIGPKPETQVSVVTITQGVEPSQALGVNRCQARPFLANLLRQINKASPQAIVIDRWFAPTGPAICPPDDSPTKELTTAISVVSKSTPIIIALETASREDPDYCKPPVKLSPTSVILTERVHFETENPKVYYGLARLTDEIRNRRIPLAWLTYEDCSAARDRKGGNLVPTLALQATAIAVNEPISKLLQRNQLDADYVNLRHPYAHFREEGLTLVSAVDVLCGETDKIDWQMCSSDTSNNHYLASLEHKIVVVGELQDRDYHDSVFGRIPGVVLQGYYIESLWESRVYRPVISWLQFAVSLAWVLVVELVFKWRATSPNFALFLCLSAALVLAVFCYSVLVVYFNFYIVLSVPGLLAMFGKWASLRLEKIDERHENVQPVPASF